MPLHLSSARKKAARRPLFRTKVPIEDQRFENWKDTAGLLVSILLALDHARVAGQEAFTLQDRTQIRLEVGERLRQPMAYGAGLARQATARNRDREVVLVDAPDDAERLLDDHAQHGSREINVEGTLVDGDLARAGLNPDTGHGILALAGRVGAGPGRRASAHRPVPPKARRRRRNLRSCRDESVSAIRRSSRSWNSWRRHRGATGDCASWGCSPPL